MQQLNLQDEAKEDWRMLYNSDPAVAERIAVVLSEIKGSQDLMDCLTTKGKWTQGELEFETYRYSELWKQGKDIYVIKVLEINGGSIDHRIIHAFNPKTKHHYILGIVPRSFNYGSNNHYTQRIVRSYELLREDW